MVLLGLAAGTCAQTQEQQPGQTSKGLFFFYRVGRHIDRFLTQNIDTAYIGLPEHCWRLAYTNGMIGVHSTIAATDVFTDNNGTPQEVAVALLNRTTPSVDLGFYAGYRGLGFGYSWDVLHAYAQRLSFSLGSKYIGLDFSIQTSTDIDTRMAVNNELLDVAAFKNNVVITNANLNVWYALNASRYSHQAAVKQSYIQRKTAGSPLLSVSYMSSQVELSDTLKITKNSQIPLLPTLMSGMTAIRTRQIAIGLGYGINYTPNKGKLVLHAAASAMLVTYSVNLVSFYLPDSIANSLPDKPMYNLRPAAPVHVTGNLRAALSWEINKWVHLSAWATADNIRFRSELINNETYISLGNWNWKVQLSVGVRLGAGKDRVQRALKEKNIVLEEHPGKTPKKNLPQWFNDFFYTL